MVKVMNRIRSAAGCWMMAFVEAPALIFPPIFFLQKSTLVLKYSSAVIFYTTLTSSVRSRTIIAGVILAVCTAAILQVAYLTYTSTFSPSLSRVWLQTLTIVFINGLFELNKDSLLNRPWPEIASMTGLSSRYPFFLPLLIHWPPTFVCSSLRRMQEPKVANLLACVFLTLFWNRPGKRNHSLVSR